MKQVTVATLLFMNTWVALGQDDPYSKVAMGPHAVGYSDTLIYNDSLQYDQYGYKGPAPLFVQQWFPVGAEVQGEPLTWGGLRHRALPNELIGVYEALEAGRNAAAIEYYLTEPIDDDVPIEYDPYTHTQVLDTLKTCPTRSRRTILPGQLDAPVIVYHHGSQGLSDENHVMAEYFASRGYCFVSANFHWPIAGEPYGAPLKWSEDHSSVNALIHHARQLTSSDSVFFIGHSWGAQQGWLSLFPPGSAQAFVSMETTIEFKTDPMEIKDKWSAVYAAFQDPVRRLPMPVLLFANTMTDEVFPFFQDQSTVAMWYASTREEFGHESYTSAYLMRVLFKEHFPQPDVAIMQRQLELYAEHLRMIDAFFRTVRNGTPFTAAPFAEQFFLNRTISK